MMKAAPILAVFLGLSIAIADEVAPTAPSVNVVPEPVAYHPHVMLQTSMGDIEIELFPEKAPITVANFLKYVDKGTYTNTIFHRVVPGFVVQGGGYGPNLSPKPFGAPIKNEAQNGLSNLRGSLAMARQDLPDSATSQFFFNLVDNTGLDYRDDSNQGSGYTVFGQVVTGMEIIDRIAQKPTTNIGMFQGLPIEPIIVKLANRLADIKGSAN